MGGSSQLGLILIERFWLIIKNSSVLFMANVNSCCSIEMEPKTLSEVQLNHAREVAADVVQKMEPKEASIIFVKGLEPVGVEEEKAHEFLKPEDFKTVANDQKTPNIIEKPCQCSLINSPDQNNLKEPVSAPF